MSPCPYCGEDVQLLHSDDLRYPYRSDYGPRWACLPCGAHVGCHKPAASGGRGDGTKPLGTVANAADRRLRGQAHALFDPLWKAKIRREGLARHKARNAGYRWLSEQTGIPRERMHISMLHGDELQAVVDLCEKYLHVR